MFETGGLVVTTYLGPENIASFLPENCQCISPAGNIGGQIAKVGENKIQEVDFNSETGPDRSTRKIARGEKLMRSLSAFANDEGGVHKA